MRIHCFGASDLHEKSYNTGRTTSMLKPLNTTNVKAKEFLLNITYVGIHVPECQHVLKA